MLRLGYPSTRIHRHPPKGHADSVLFILLVLYVSCLFFSGDPKIQDLGRDLQAAANFMHEYFTDLMVAINPNPVYSMCQ